jgi:probable rRNA maturation factor
MSTQAPLTADILIEADCWQQEPEASDLVRRALAQAAKHSPEQVADAEVAIMLTDDDGVQALNRDWRGIDKPTNVLSFPAPEPAAGIRPRPLGDIAIAYETTRREAESESKPFAHHLSHLAVHGFLHLIGYDHETDDEAETMENLEREILSQLGVPDPYR